MHLRRLGVEGALEVTPQQFTDTRGIFLEAFKQGCLAAAVGRVFDVAQANVSVSAAGVLRGIHFSENPPGQAKYVTCVAGAVLDVVVDLRVGSPTFGRWDSVLLDDRDRRATFVPEGLGHAFMSLSEAATVMYLCSTPYSPAVEHGIDPFDAMIGVDWPTRGVDGRPLTPVLSDKDATAPSLAEARERGLLPTWETCTGHIRRAD